MNTRAAAARAPHSRARSAAGWLAAAASLAYVGLCHHGLGEPAGGLARYWFEPRGFMHGWKWLGALSDLDTQYLDIAALLLPALLLTACTHWATRSSIARALSLSSVAGSGLLAYYGLYAPGPWEFFRWRGSAVLLALALAVGFAAAAPMLARSWLRRDWPLRVVLYGPVALGCVALMRHATGWDTQLRFNISPWPAIPIFGLDVAAYLVSGLLMALSIAVAAARGPGLAAAGAAGGGALLCACVAVRFALDPGRALLLLLVYAVAAILCVGTARGPARPARARHLALGAALVALPILSGRALESGDYANTRFARAQVIIDALGRYFAREQIYPDRLEELVRSGLLREVPRPRVGFDSLYALDLLDPVEFEYQSHGSSYVLEFVSTAWVQCAYNPPWVDEEQEEPDPEDADLAEGAWSCPDEHPELW